MLGLLDLKGIYKTTTDEKYRVAFPSDFGATITEKIGTGYHLLILPQRRDDMKFFRITPTSRSNYEEKAEQMNKKDKDNLERKDFFRQFMVRPDRQGRITLPLIAQYMGYEPGKEYFFVGRGDFCDLLAPDAKEISDLIQ